MTTTCTWMMMFSFDVQWAECFVWHYVAFNTFVLLECPIPPVYLHIFSPQFLKVFVDSLNAFLIIYFKCSDLHVCATFILLDNVHVPRKAYFYFYLYLLFSQNVFSYVRRLPICWKIVCFMAVATSAAYILLIILFNHCLAFVALRCFNSPDFMYFNFII